MISLRNITKSYGEVKALRGVSLEIGEGEFVAVAGPSGSGKSTLLSILGCLDAPDGGEYMFYGRNVGKLRPKERAALRGREIGFVFQSFNLIPRLTALENAALPLMFLGVPQKERRRIASETLYKVGLGDRLAHRPGELSGGQQQRCAIARALCAKPKVILADEPTGNLDPENASSIVEILRNCGSTVIMITHDMKFANSAARVIKIENGVSD